MSARGSAHVRPLLPASDVEVVTGATGTYGAPGVLPALDVLGRTLFRSSVYMSTCGWSRDAACGAWRHTWSAFASSRVWSAWAAVRDAYAGRYSCFISAHHLFVRAKVAIRTIGFKRVRLMSNEVDSKGSILPVLCRTTKRRKNESFAAVTGWVESKPTLRPVELNAWEALGAHSTTTRARPNSHVACHYIWDYKWTSRNKVTHISEIRICPCP